MKSVLTLVVSLIAAGVVAGGADAPKGPPDWKVDVVAETPTVNFCSVVCCAPDGRVFLAEDPMDMPGPPNQPIDRILCLHPNGKITVFADKLYAVFGLYYLDGKLYVHHCPRFSVFDDGGTVAKNRVDLIDCTNPRPWGGMNDHIPSNMRLGMDGWFYLSTGDKGIYGAVGKDGSKAEIHGGGVLRFRPDGTHLEVYCTGTRNHLDVALNAEDEMFTYDNTDDGNGWWTRLTHMVDGGFYGYPYDYKPRRPYTLWMMADYGGGSPTGALAYNEDALPAEYHGNLFMCEWGRGQLARFVVERDGGSYRVVRRDNFLTKGAREFRPVGIAVSADGMSIYLADWNYGGWSNRTLKAGRLLKATWTGKSQAAPKPAWFLPASMGKEFKATTQELVTALRHPGQSVRLVAMRRAAERGQEAVPLLVKLLKDAKAPPHARWSAIWTLDRIDEGKAGREAIWDALEDKDASVRRQAARQLGTRGATERGLGLARLLKDGDPSVRFQAATALGRIGKDVEDEAWLRLMDALDEDDLFVRYAVIKAFNRICRARPTMWDVLVVGLALSDKRSVQQAALLAFRETYEVEAIEALAPFAGNLKAPARANERRAEALALLGELSRKRPAWKGEWWGTQPVRSRPPARSVNWDGTEKAVAALGAGLQDKSEIVRAGAARGMIASDDPTVYVAVVKHLPAEKDAGARKAMLEGLGHARNPDAAYTQAADRLAAELLGDPARHAGLLPELLAFAANLPSTSRDVTAAMLKLVGTDLPAAEMNRVLETLAKSPSDEATAAIAGRVHSTDAGVRSSAVKLLTGRKGDEAGKALVQALHDKAPAVAKEAVIALGKRRDRTAVPVLLACLSDKQLRFEAITALAQLPDVHAVDAYLQGLAGRNAGQRNACARALASIQGAALPRIEERLGKTPPLSSDAIFQLQKIYDKNAAARKGPLFRISVKTVALEELAAAALKQKGLPERGRKLFFDARGAACSKCHRVGKEGGDIGPDLSGIASRYNRAQLIESVLYPSKQILDGYQVTVIETKNGQVISGIVRNETEDRVTLLDADGKKHVLKKADVETRVKSDKSLMPDGLEAGMSPSDFADLIGFLESLREKSPPPASPSSKTGRLPAPERGALPLAPEDRRASANGSTRVPSRAVDLGSFNERNRTCCSGETCSAGRWIGRGLEGITPARKTPMQDGSGEPSGRLRAGEWEGMETA